MLRWFRSLILREIVDDVPPEMSLCLDCRKLECTEGEYRACAPRRARAAEAAAAAAKDAGTGRS